MKALFIVLRFVVLHTVGGYDVSINPAQITTLTAPRAHRDHDGLFTNEAQCAIGLADGKFVTVAETCEAVRQALKDNQ